uniref:Uncharacterized protein n=1 Tax=Opuntia streptacantha TaxID=393608 RepID=A0A7C9E4X8_OPUST
MQVQGIKASPELTILFFIRHCLWGIPLNVCFRRIVLGMASTACMHFPGYVAGDRQACKSSRVHLLKDSKRQLSTIPAIQSEAECKKAHMRGEKQGGKKYICTVQGNSAKLSCLQ